MGKEKNILQNEFTDIMDIISGEMDLREKEERIEKLKEDAKKGKRAEKRKKIVEKDIVLEESDIPTKKVVQNIKLFEWEALERYQLKFENKTFLIFLFVSLILVLYFVILGRYYLMASVIALLFFFYVAGTYKPMKVKYKITARGVEYNNKLYEWFMLESFWFSIKEDQYFLNINTRLRYPSALILLLNKEDKDVIFVLLQEKLLYKDIRKQSGFDRVSYGTYIPFDKV